MVYALEPSTGATIWSRNFPGGAGHPGVAGGRVFVTAGIGDGSALWALQASDGSAVYSTPFENQLSFYFAPVVSQGVVVAGGTAYGGVYAYAEGDGEVLWTQGTNHTPYSWWAPAIAGDVVYQVGTSGSASMLTYMLSSGEKQAQVSIGCFCQGAFTPAVVGPDAALAVIGNSLTRFDMVSGTISWTRDGKRFLGLAADSSRVYSLTDQVAEVLDLATGAVEWTWTPAGGSLAYDAPLLVTRNLLFVGVGSSIYAVSLETHETVWTYPAEGFLSLSKGVLYVAEADGAVHAIAVGG